MEIGDVLAERFEIERIAGSGGMGAVYRARDRHTGAPVAIKVLREGMGEGSGTDRFVREARVLSELRHPGIVRYVAHGMTPAGERYLAMEWLEGQSLSMRMRRKPLTLIESVTLATFVAEALGAAHRQGVVHRDLKPSNLFLPKGEDVSHVKVLDFGVARSNSAEGVTAVGGVIGTPSYMSPEQARGDANVDARADVFAIGCVLFKCLTGSSPFEGGSPNVVLARIINDPAPPLSAFRDDTPEALEELIARVLAKNPADRPANGDALAEQLSAINTLSEVQAKRESRPPAASITRTEQRLSCFVLARPVTEDEQSVLASVARSFGARVMSSGDDGALALSSQGAATDLAAQAARCALAVRDTCGAAAVALVTGFGDLRARAAGILGADALRTIAIDEVTAGLLDARFETASSPNGVELRGERQQVAASRTLLGRPNPCVGRERELLTLEAIFAECISEPVARAVLIAAPSGLGKSRVRFEFVAKVREREEPSEVWLGRGDPMTAGSPFSLLASALRETLGILDGEAPEARRLRVRARVARNVQEAQVARVSAFLGEMMGVPFPSESEPALAVARQDPMLMSDRIQQAFEDFVAAECNAYPVVLVLEDLHWGDLPSVKIVDALLRNLGDRALMVLALARPEIDDSFPRLWEERGVQELRLAPLTKKASERLVRDALGKDADQRAIARIVDRAGGNAFYLEELIRASASGKGDALPDTVLAMVQARLESLEVEARRVLRAASVFGQLFWRGSVSALLGDELSETRLDEWLAYLEDREVIFRRGETRFLHDEELIFRHSLLRDASYAMLTDQDRVLGHRLAAQWLESSGENQARVLAEHHEQGRQPERAAACYLRAADQAREGNDMKAAIACGERAIACGAEGELLARVRLVQAEAHRWRGEQAEASRCSAEAMERLPHGSPAWCVALGEYAAAQCRLGRIEEIDGLAEALCTIDPIEADLRHVSALAQVAVAATFHGRYALVDRMLDWMTAVHERHEGNNPLIAARVLRVRGYRAHVAGDEAAYLRLTDRAQALVAAAGAERDACGLRSVVGYAQLLLGSYAQAEQTLREALAIAERLGSHTISAVSLHNLGCAVFRLGRVDEGIRIESQAIEQSIKQGDRRIEPGARGYLAEMLTHKGELDAAEREIDGGLANANDPMRAWLLALRANVLLARGDGPRALEHVSEGMVIYRRLGGIEEGAALIRLVHVKALHAAGHEDEARKELADARDTLIGRAKRLSDETLRETFLRCVPEHAETLALANDWFGGTKIGIAG